MTNEALVVVVRADGALSDPEALPAAWVRGERLGNGAPRAVVEAVRAAAAGAPRAVLVEGRAPVIVVAVDGVPLRRAVVAVDVLVGRTMDLFVAQTRGRDVELAVERGANVPPAITADGEKLAWVLATLVGNALRATDRSDGAHRIVLGIAYDAPERTVIMEVSDDGPGMPRETARWLFERDPATGRSAGLGLRMVADVVAAHGGTVSVTSAPGDGTRVTIRLPRRA